ncbi:Fic family protein [Mariniflexile soesokkakense]
MKYDSKTNKPISPIIKAGIAHIYFVSIHPFEDGNGRIARAIAKN